MHTPRLSENQSAIPFDTHDYLGNRISLTQYRGKKIYLSFFRDVNCPFCNIRLNELIKKHEDFKKSGIEILAFFGSTKDQILEHAREEKAPFPVIPDSNLVIYGVYGVETSLKAKFRTIKTYKKVIEAIKSDYFNLKSFTERNIVPADFLIDEKLIIERAHYGQDFADHIPTEEILNWTRS